jgi:hypothetical protein
MVGAGALAECLADDRVQSVVALTRSPLNRTHPKLREVRRDDFFHYNDCRAEFAACDALSLLPRRVLDWHGREDLHAPHLRPDACRRSGARGANPRMTFCYVSGVGTDSTERGSRMWAGVKSRTENALLALPFKAAFMFRPGYIQPVGDVRSRTGWVQTVYTVIGPLYPVVRRLMPNATTTTANLGRALIQVAASGYSKRVLYSTDMNRLAGDAG